MPCYVDPPGLCYGVFLENPPVLVDAPEGSRVKMRFRSDELAKAYIRHRNGTFSSWYLEFTDETHTKVRLLYPIAQNVRQTG